MPGRITPLVNGEIYHVYNRGSSKQKIFIQPRDYKRFQQTFYYYQFIGPKPKFSNYAKSKLNLFKLSNEKIVEIISYCLMPNHFHFLIKQLEDSGISIFISQLTNSYTKYFNTKYSNVGALLQGVFKSVLVESDEQLLHLSRYIHLNPIVQALTKNLDTYPWSSYSEYKNAVGFYSFPEEILKFFPSSEAYCQFVQDQIDYGLTLENIKHQLLEEI